MFLVVGLGNPGPGYAGNRHNIGYMAADLLVRRHGFGPWKKKFQGLLAEGSIGAERVLVLKPETWMNLSGQSAGEAARFYKIPLERIIVLHDDLDLAPGKVRVKRGGGAGGHNGLRSLDDHLGPDYRRVRLGVGHPGEKDAVTGHVLDDFAKADKAWLDPLLDALAEAFPLLLAGDDNGFMNKVVVKTQPPREKKTPPAPASPPPSSAPPPAPKDEQKVD